MLGPCDSEKAAAAQPMLGDLDSTDSSRLSSACHSRNCSEGATPPYVKEGSEERLLENLVPHLCRPITSTLRVVIPESLLNGSRGGGEEEEEEDILQSKEEEDC